MFFRGMRPVAENKEHPPSDFLKEALARDFESFENFQAQFKKASVCRLAHMFLVSF
jgi:superoxide dismutase